MVALTNGLTASVEGPLRGPRDLMSKLAERDGRFRRTIGARLILEANIEQFTGATDVDQFLVDDAACAGTDAQPVDAGRRRLKLKGSVRIDRGSLGTT